MGRTPKLVTKTPKGARTDAPRGPSTLAGRRALAAAAALAPLVMASGRVLAGDEVAATPAPASAWVDTLGGDWDGSRLRLQELGVRVEPRLSQFVQGLASGDGDTGVRYGGKADVLVSADLARLGLRKGQSITLHAEYNFGRNVNGQGGVAIPVNSALEFPGIDGSDAFDISSFYFTQPVGDRAAVLFGKINMVDMASKRDFMGGAGIDAFWNLTFVAPPSGTVPPYLLGMLANLRTEAATYHLWVYDPVSVVNKSVFEDPFTEGVSIRGSVEFPVTLAGLPGHQALTALYSTQGGTDLSSLDGILLPSPVPGTAELKDSRYYFAWSFDQTLVRSAQDFGLFGQAAVSDGNPNGLHRSFFLGVGGRGLVPGHSGDNWGIGYYYDNFSQDLKDALEPAIPLRDEQGVELFYNFALAPWCVLGLDLQIIRPALAGDTAVLPGMRAVIRF